MKKTAVFLSLTVMAALAALPSAAWGAPLQAKQRQMKTNEEYQAYMAMNNEKDPNQKLSLADAFVQKFPDSDFKDMAYFQKMAAYQQLGKVVEALDAGHKALEINPDSLDVINLEATLIPYYTFKAGDSAGTEMLSRAETDVKHGLDLLAKLTKPENVKPEDWDKAVKSARAGIAVVAGDRHALAQGPHPVPLRVRHRPGRHHDLRDAVEELLRDVRGEARDHGLEIGESHDKNCVNSQRSTGKAPRARISSHGAGPVDC